MGFNTLPFVFVFLPLFLAAFYLVPARWRAGLLCLGSLVFYVIGVWQRPWCLAPLLEFPIVKDTTPNMMNPRLYTTSYNKPQGQQFDDTAVLSFIKLQYT